MAELTSKKTSSVSNLPLSSIQFVKDLTHRTANLKAIDSIFSETISSLKSQLKTNAVHIYTYAIKNQKIDFEYHRIGVTGELKKREIPDIPSHAELIRAAVAQKKTAYVQVNPDNQAFVSSDVSSLIRIAIPFLYRGKVFGCIHISCSASRLKVDEIITCGELIGHHLELLYTKAIEQQHLNEFKTRVRKLINVKVTELEKALESAAKYNQSLKDFSYIVSHDLREPLRTINSYIKLLERRYNDHFDADAKDFMFFVTDGVARMDALIQDLLVFSRVEHSVYQFEEVPLFKIMTLVENALRLKIEETDATVTFDNPPDIFASRSHLTILFQNLIDNAIKFSKEDQAPVVHITAKELDNHWQFSVQDNGIGMNLEHKNNERIFKIFQRLHGATSKIPGTGIGLAICQNIVNAHGGKIWVNSNPEKGATFYFTLSKHLLKD